MREKRLTRFITQGSLYSLFFGLNNDPLAFSELSTIQSALVVKGRYRVSLVSAGESLNLMPLLLSPEPSLGVPYVLKEVDDATPWENAT